MYIISEWYSNLNVEKVNMKKQKTPSGAFIEFIILDTSGFIP